MDKRSILLSSLFALAVTATAAPYAGTVFDDRNGNGLFDKGDRTLAGVAVTDGLNVVTTDSRGHFELPGYEGTRFVTITTPSGYLTNNRHYIHVDPKVESYDFALTRYDNGVRKDGSHQFIQLTDTEIFNTTRNEEWVDDIRRYCANEKMAFVMHTGDICYIKGLNEHIKLMNTANMGVPVFYAIGNHDLVAGKYGEELFEQIYGPVYYSFDVAGTHYVVTPMAGGDHAPSYNRNQVARWLRNDLAKVKPGTPVYVFNHDLLTSGDHFVYGGNTDSIDLNEHNLKAWIYGHWHINLERQQGPVLTVCTSTLDKGGIDHSTSAYRVFTVDRQGRPTSQLRYTYIHDNVAIASPVGATSASKVVANVYSSLSPVASVTYTCLADGKPVTKEQRMTQRTDWTWEASLALKPELQGRELTMVVKARFRSGTEASKESTFVYAPGSVNLAADGNWDNLLGNASHTGGVTTARIDSIPALAWTTNVGANIYMTSPLIHNGRVYTASVDEDLKGQAAVYALDLATGAIAWTYPTEGSIKNTIAITDDKVFAQDVFGKLYAINCSDGSTAWTAQMPVNGLPAIIEGLVTDGDRVYAGTGKALTAFDAATGRIIWRNKDWNQGEGTTSTLAVGAGVVVGSVQWSALYGNDADNGRMLWRLSGDGLSDRGASAAIHDGLIYITSRESFFIIDARTGRVVVRKPLGKKVDVTSTPLLTDSEIIFGSSTEGLIALDVPTLDTKWVCPVGDALVYTGPYTRPESAQIETSPVLAGSTVYVAASDGGIYGVDKATGRVVWQYGTGAPMFSSVAVSGNVLVATDFGGNVYAFGSEKR